jgi:beta-xylosidase
MKSPLPAIAVTLAASAILCSPAKANPLFKGADPHVLEANETWWIYPTAGGDSTFSVWSSKDLKTWKQGPNVLDLKTIPWLTKLKRPLGAWAPSTIGKDGRFYFYYSVGPQSPGVPSIIGVASGENPEGPFTDSGKPLLIGGDGFEAIDPMVFCDPKTGKHWFYAGGSDGSRLRIFEMNNDLISFRGEVETDQPLHFTEGPFVHEREGTYYLSYSHGRFNTKDYSVHYATSETPTGPWKYRGCILESDATHQGPGHHSFIRTQDAFLIVYHRWDTTDTTAPLKGSRVVAMEPVHYDENGLILPIRMTDR